MATRILVAEDEDTLREVVTRVLKRQGHDVTGAANGEEALELFRKEPFALVITDIVMGGMTGLDLLREIRLISPETLTVVMTSHASIETATEALRCGAYDFLIKPFEDLGLIATVANRAIEKIRLVGENQKLVTELRQQAEALANLNRDLAAMANKDGLTGLANKRYFMESYENALARSKRYDRILSLVFLDIDRFKNYNDTNGHLAGDELLKQVSHLIDERCRASDIPARYGGEEFVIVLPETDVNEAVAFAEDLRALVEQMPFPGRQAQPDGKVTMSLGVATFPQHATCPTTLLDRADKALYHAKNTGRNRVVCWSEVVDTEGTLTKA